MKRRMWKSPETQFTLACLVIGGLGFAFLGSLVAEPKLLFGRSLTAISPTLFPAIVLAILFVLCAIQIGLLVKGGIIPAATGITGWARGVIFFGIMTAYALLMIPLGFFISSALAITSLSVFIGNRSIWQIAILAFAAPALLYLAATRLLAVSLPEINAMELFYARLLGG